MTQAQWIFIAIVAALGLFSVYLANENNRLGDRIASLEKTVAQEGTARETAIGELRTRVETSDKELSDTLKANISELENAVNDLSSKTAALGSTEQIAETLVEQKFSDLVAEVSEAIAKDPEKAAVLRGRPGPMPSAEEIRAALQSPELIQSIASEIWENHSRELTVMPEVIATVAREVYQTYGENLKGEQGQSVNVNEVANALLADPFFLSSLITSREE